MKKYLFIILAVLVILELVTLAIYWDELTRYVSNMVSSGGAALLYLALIIAAIILMLRAVMP